MKITKTEVFVLGDPELNSTAVIVIVLCLLKGKWSTAVTLAPLVYQKVSMVLM